jgi:hypothetical protein
MHNNATITYAVATLSVEIRVGNVSLCIAGKLSLSHVLHVQHLNLTSCRLIKMIIKMTRCEAV